MVSRATKEVHISTWQNIEKQAELILIEAFRDNTAGRRYNRDQPTEGQDGAVRGRDSGPGTHRAGRGPRGGPRRGGDRHVNRSGREYVQYSL